MKAMSSIATTLVENIDAIIIITLFCTHQQIHIKAAQCRSHNWLVMTSPYTSNERQTHKFGTANMFRNKHQTTTSSTTRRKMRIAKKRIISCQGQPQVDDVSTMRIFHPVQQVFFVAPRSHFSNLYIASRRNLFKTCALWRPRPKLPQHFGTLAESSPTRRLLRRIRIVARWVKCISSALRFTKWRRRQSICTPVAVATPILVLLDLHLCGARWRFATDTQVVKTCSKCDGEISLICQSDFARNNL